MKPSQHMRILVAVALVAALLVGLMPVRSVSAQAPMATVNTGALHLRSGPGVSYTVVFSVYRGTALTLLARNADTSWLKVALDNGVQGWVSRPYVYTVYPLGNLPVDGGWTGSGGLGQPDMEVGRILGEVMNKLTTIPGGPKS